MPLALLCPTSSLLQPSSSGSGLSKRACHTLSTRSARSSRSDLAVDAVQPVQQQQLWISRSKTRASFTHKYSDRSCCHWRSPYAIDNRPLVVTHHAATVGLLMCRAWNAIAPSTIILMSKLMHVPPPPTLSLILLFTLLWPLATQSALQV